jgi:uncharacterized protein YkwD
MHHLKQTTHAGPDGSDPPLRGRQVGYEGRIIGETQAETPTSAAEIVDEWLDYEGTRAVLLDPAARYAGVAGFRDNAGLLRIDLVVGA